MTDDEEVNAEQLGAREDRCRLVLALQLHPLDLHPDLGLRELALSSHHLQELVVALAVGGVDGGVRGDAGGGGRGRTAEER